jgi:hypothetical protein
MEALVTVHGEIEMCTEVYMTSRIAAVQGWVTFVCNLFIFQIKQIQM